MTRKEKSCGGVIIKDGEVLVVWQSNEEERIIAFPKGHMEPGETEIETAKREILEETGVEAELDEAKRIELYYYIEKLDIDKTVVLFIGKPVGETKIRPQEGEINEVMWMKIADVEDALVRDAWKDAWKKARKMIEEEK